MALLVVLRISTSLLRSPLVEADTTLHKVLIFIIALTGFSLSMDTGFAYAILFGKPDARSSFRAAFSDFLFGFLFLVAMAMSFAAVKGN